MTQPQNNNMALYFRLWLIMPFLFALAGYLSQWVPILLEIPLVPLAGAGILFSGIPYAVLVVGALIWSFAEKNSDYRKAFFISPIIFYLLCSVFFSLVVRLSVAEQNRPVGIFPGGNVIAQISGLVHFIYAMLALAIWFIVNLFRRSSNNSRS